MKKFVLFISLFFCVCFYTAAQSKAEADQAYAQSDFQKAAVIYGDLLKRDRSSILYYNLGNCYYRMGMASKALLNYERSILLDPSDKDTRTNIEFLNTQLLDKTTRPTKFFFVTWMESLQNSMDLHHWIFCGILSFVLFLGCTFLYLFSKSINVRKTGFFSALLLLVLCIVSNLFAYGHYLQLTQRNTALIMVSGATVRSSPTDTGTTLTTLPEGLKIRVTDDSMKEWKEIEFDHDKVGWIKATDLEII